MDDRQGDALTTRTFAAGAFEFRVSTARAEDTELMESLFRDLPSPASPPAAPAAFSLISRAPLTTVWMVDTPRRTGVASSSLSPALVNMIGDLNLCALDAEPEHLHLHAAAAVRDGRAVVIAAPRNTGKSTTVAHLVARGWEFVTDEMVRVPSRTGRVTGFSKPLSVKPSGRAQVPHLEPFMIPAAEDDDDMVFRFVPMSATGARVVDGGTPHVIVILRRRPAIEPQDIAETKPIHPADAVVALMQETLDAERFGSAAVTLASLAAASRCFEVTRGTPTETAEAIEGLAEGDETNPLAVDVDVALRPPSATITAGVVSVQIGDRAVVHDTASGRIFALDAGGTRVWNELGGWAPDPDVDLDGPAVGTFVNQLRSLGVLAGSDGDR